jgi:AI-2 transport protein TqsA
VLIAVILTVAALWFAATVFAPLACALLIIALVWPLQAWLERSMPRAVALIICILLILAVFGAFGTIVVWAFGRVIRWLIAEAPRFQMLYTEAMAWLEARGITLAGIWSDYFSVGQVLRTLQNVSGRLNSMATFWLIVFVYVILGLMEVDEFARRARALDNQRLGAILVGGSRETAFKLRRYMLVRTLMSVITGLIVFGFVRFMGLGFAVEWGVIAFALNYIPFLGPFLATLFPTVFAMVQLETWQAVIWLFVGLNLVQSVIGSYFEPRVSGNALALSPVVVLFSVFLWAFLWGIFGAFIGVPITIAVVAFCARDPSSRWLAELLGAPPRREWT